MTAINQKTPMKSVSSGNMPMAGTPPFSLQLKDQNTQPNSSINANKEKDQKKSIKILKGLATANQKMSGALSGQNFVSIASDLAAIRQSLEKSDMTQLGNAVGGFAATLLQMPADVQYIYANMAKDLLKNAPKSTPANTPAEISKMTKVLSAVPRIVSLVDNLRALGFAIHDYDQQVQKETSPEHKKYAMLHLANTGVNVGLSLAAIIAGATGPLGAAFASVFTVVMLLNPGYSAIAAATDLKKSMDQAVKEGKPASAGIYHKLYTMSALNAVPVLNWFGFIYNTIIENDIVKTMNGSFYNAIFREDFLSEIRSGSFVDSAEKNLKGSESTRYFSSINNGVFSTLNDQTTAVTGVTFYHYDKNKSGDQKLSAQMYNSSPSLNGVPYYNSIDLTKTDQQESNQQQFFYLKHHVDSHSLVTDDSVMKSLKNIENGPGFVRATANIKINTDGATPSGHNQKTLIIKFPKTGVEETFNIPINSKFLVQKEETNDYRIYSPIQQNTAIIKNIIYEDNFTVKIPKGDFKKPAYLYDKEKNETVESIRYTYDPQTASRTYFFPGGKSVSTINSQHHDGDIAMFITDTENPQKENNITSNNGTIYIGNSVNLPYNVALDLENTPNSIDVRNKSKVSLNLKNAGMSTAFIQNNADDTSESYYDVSVRDGKGTNVHFYDQGIFNGDNLGETYIDPNTPHLMDQNYTAKKGVLLFKNQYSGSTAQTDQSVNVFTYVQNGNSKKTPFYTNSISIKILRAAKDDIRTAKDDIAVLYMGSESLTGKKIDGAVQGDIFEFTKKSGKNTEKIFVWIDKDNKNMLVDRIIIPGLSISEQGRSGDFVFEKERVPFFLDSNAKTESDDVKSLTLKNSFRLGFLGDIPTGAAVTHTAPAYGNFYYQTGSGVYKYINAENYLAHPLINDRPYDSNNDEGGLSFSPDGLTATLEERNFLTGKMEKTSFYKKTVATDSKFGSRDIYTSGSNAVEIWRYHDQNGAYTGIAATIDKQRAHNQKPYAKISQANTYVTGSGPDTLNIGNFIKSPHDTITKIFDLGDGDNIVNIHDHRDIKIYTGRDDDQIKIERTSDFNVNDKGGNNKISLDHVTANNDSKDYHVLLSQANKYVDHTQRNTISINDSSNIRISTEYSNDDYKINKVIGGKFYTGAGEDTLDIRDSSHFMLMGQGNTKINLKGKIGVLETSEQSEDDYLVTPRFYLSGNSTIDATGVASGSTFSLDFVEVPVDNHQKKNIAHTVVLNKKFGTFYITENKNKLENHSITIKDYVPRDPSDPTVDHAAVSIVLNEGTNFDDLILERDYRDGQNKVRIKSKKDDNFPEITITLKNQGITSPFSPDNFAGIEISRHDAQGNWLPPTDLSTLLEANMRR